MKTEILSPAEITKAVDVIFNDGTVALPTETVWGICANGLSEAAIAAVYEAKGRPETKPMSLFVSDMDMAEKLCADIPAGAYALAEAFWPGPLTMVLKRKEIVPDVLTAGGKTVGLRCPESSLALALVRMTGLPLTGTSANLSGEPNAESFEEVIRCFDGKLNAVFRDDAPCGGLPSTVVDMTGDELKILRQGEITERDIEAALKENKELWSLG